MGMTFWALVLNPENEFYKSQCIQPPLLHLKYLYYLIVFPPSSSCIPLNFHFTVVTNSVFILKIYGAVQSSFLFVLVWDILLSVAY